MKRIAALAPFRALAWISGPTTGISIRALDHDIGKKLKAMGWYFFSGQSTLFDFKRLFIFAVDNVDSLGNIPERQNSARFLTVDPSYVHAL